VLAAASGAVVAIRRRSAARAEARA
jgi:hypothetical protein